MSANALKKGNAEFAAIANAVIQERFPHRPIRRGGPTPTSVIFQSSREEFDNGKEAYLWLADQFCRFREDAMELYSALHARAGSRSKGRRFATHPDDLFPEGSPRKGNSAFYSRLMSGWYADTNLSHKDKFAALMQLSYVCKLEYGSDWDFRVSGATSELLENQEAIRYAAKILDELLGT